MFQMKEQDKTPEEQQSEVERANLPEKEFKVMIVKMIQELEKKMDAQSEKLQEVFNKELENIKNNQTELKNTITEKELYQVSEFPVMEWECPDLIAFPRFM